MKPYKSIDPQLLELFSTFIYGKVGRDYANQSKASRAEKPWAHARRVARNRKPQPYTRKSKSWAQTRVARIKAAPVQTRTRATKSRGPLQQESHASSSRRSTKNNRLQLFLKWRVDVVSYPQGIIYLKLCFFKFK